MSEHDRALARRALERNRLSSGQVEQLLEEAARTGVSFRDLSVGRGLLSAQDFPEAPPKEIPLPTMLLLAAGLSLLAILLVNATMNRATARDRAAVVERATPSSPERAPGPKARIDARAGTSRQDPK